MLTVPDYKNGKIKNNELIGFPVKTEEICTLHPSVAREAQTPITKACLLKLTVKNLAQLHNI